MVGVEEWKAIGDESGGEECAGRNFFLGYVSFRSHGLEFLLGVFGVIKF
jgi:hypothetical protein